MNFSTLLPFLLIAEAAYADSTVQTTNGPVRGTTVASGKVEAFLGIPYAEPPVGRLRFAKPVSKTPWKNVYHANQLPPACIQTSRFEFFPSDITRMSEDCLYLNIWVPHSLDKPERKTIIIVIPGGGFMAGSGSEGYHDGTSLAEHGNVIVVTINYRLGGLGFFTGFVDEAPGNIGMHDQVAAIRWVKENAEIFQGDPTNIVLMGQSAGAISVSAHLISPLTKNLFRRAIMFGGSIYHPTFSNNNKIISQLSEKYASIVGCTGNFETVEYNPKSIIECMKNLPVEKFMEADLEIVTNSEKTTRDPYSLFLHPRVGDDFLPENTIDSFLEGDFKDTEILIGTARNEGSSLISGFAPALISMLEEKNVSTLFNNSSTRQFIKNFMSSGDDCEDDKIIQTYMDRVNEHEENAYLKALVDAFGDYSVSCGSVFQADILSLRNNPIFFYVFDYLSPLSDYPKWMGVPHGEDLYYVLGNFFLREYTKMDKDFSRNLMERFFTFSKTGNPNIPKGVTWPRYTFKDPKYLMIGEQDRVETKPDFNRCEVWRKRYGSIIDDYLIRSINNIESHQTVRFYSPLYTY